MAEYKGVIDKDVIDTIMSQISKTSVEAVFGENRQIGDKVIIPVGKVSYGWGGGGGKGQSKKEGELAPEGEGGGVGMGVKVQPIGYITVTADNVTYQPVVDIGPVMLIFGTIFGLIVLKSFKMMSGKMYMGKCPMMKGKWGKWGGMNKFGHKVHMKAAKK